MKPLWRTGYESLRKIIMMIHFYWLLLSLSVQQLCFKAAAYQNQTQLLAFFKHKYYSWSQCSYCCYFVLILFSHCCCSSLHFCTVGLMEEYIISSYLISFYFVLCCLIVSYFMLYCLIFSWCVLSYLVLSRLFLSISPDWSFCLLSVCCTKTVCGWDDWSFHAPIL